MIDPWVQFYFKNLLKGMVKDVLSPLPPIPTYGPLDISCLYCKAAVQKPCVTESGKVSKTFHKDRSSPVHLGRMAEFDSGRCINLCCHAGKVWSQGKEILCPGCNGTGMRVKRDTKTI